MTAFPAQGHGHFEVGTRSVGAGEQCLVIAEVGQAHDGSLGAAHAYIDAVADVGGEAIKFQTHFADEESTPEEPWRTKFSHQDVSRFAYWNRMEFSDEQWAQLAAHAEDRGLLFLSSPFSLRALYLLERLRVPAWKVASGEVGNTPLLRAMADTGRPLLLSSGLSDWAELDVAVEIARSTSTPFGVLQATTAYPCPPNRLGLNVLEEIDRRYGCPFGLSDHSATIFAGLAAATLGASFVEAHITFSRRCFGPDSAASLTIEELGRLIEGTRFIHEAMTHPSEKDSVSDETRELKRMFGKSIVAASALAAGTRLGSPHLAFKKPGIGLPPSAASELLGRTLSRDVQRNHRISWDDLEPI